MAAFAESSASGSPNGLKRGLLPEPATAGATGASVQRAAAIKLGLFVFFVLTRALHPMLIDLSKVDGKILYAKNTPVVMNKLCTIVLMNGVMFLTSGVDGIKSCWQPRVLAVFGMIGIVYALGDCLEMLSMSKLSGGVYQVLLQTKLLITALIGWRLKGQGQSALQWHVLMLIFLASSCFVLVDQGSRSADSADLPLMAIFIVLMKVTVSCYCAVLSEKNLKAFGDLPVPAKISGLATTWALASLIFSLFERQVQETGFFAHWDSMTWVVTASFTVKTVSTMYLLQALDSVQKNIGEALAVIVIYGGQVLHPSVDKAFDLTVFLVAVLVVSSVKTYLVTPKLAKGKAKVPAARRRAQDVKVVAVQPAGDSLTCQVAEALPSGVFYGMLGGVYPVCGTTDQASPTSCELSFVAQPPQLGSAAPLQLPSQSLAVLGAVREAAPGERPDARRRLDDVEQARTQLSHRFAQLLSEP